MNAPRKYDVDIATKVEDGKLGVAQSQDVTSAILGAKELKKVDGGNKGEGKHVAKIPILLLYKWAKEDCGDQFAYVRGRHAKEPDLAAKFMRRLNDLENKDFRVWDGKIATSDIYKG